MINPNQKSDKQLKVIKIIALTLLVIAPLVFLIVASFIQIEKQQGGQIELLFYILLVLAMIQPLMLPIIVRVQISTYRKNKSSAMSPLHLYTTLSIIKLAFIESIFVYGLVVFLISGDISKMLFFYPVGIAWSIVHWPKEFKYEKFIKEMEKI